ncbi:MAG: hypothetical protein WBG92_23825 [Thiohalocapsa sp.]
MAIMLRNLRTHEVHEARVTFPPMVSVYRGPVVLLVDNGEPVDPDSWAVDWVDDFDRAIVSKLWRLPSED